MPFTTAPIRKLITSYYLLPHMSENRSSSYKFLTPFPTTVQPVMKFGVIYKEVVPVWVSLLKLQENTFSLNCCGIWS